MKVKFWGVRGSIPVPGPKTVKYGGNTSCVELNCDGKIIILDSGTGIRELGHDIMNREFCKRKMEEICICFLAMYILGSYPGLPFFSTNICS
jgi:phosphoribosyl 1,2-cyclic phosphodiesterase